MGTCRGKRLCSSGDPVFNVSEIKNRIDPVRKDPFYLAKNTQIILKNNFKK